ncbi:hypothetical protein DFH09DRAFT_3149 [Mycena vulgaris]|nr:hypothetical protein DFH09DRAFT_3149 [Mycena vulgaris]
MGPPPTGGNTGPPPSGSTSSRKRQASGSPAVVDSSPSSIGGGADQSPTIHVPPSSPSAGRARKKQAKTSSTISNKPQVPDSDVTIAVFGHRSKAPVTYASSRTTQSAPPSSPEATEFMTDAGEESEPDFRLNLDDEEQEEEDDLIGDPSFVEPEPTTRRELKASAVQQSPRKRALKGSSIASHAKQLASAADPNHGQCILTGANAPPKRDPPSKRVHMPVQWCHILQRATEFRQLTVLEYRWGMTYYTLYIDTKHNLVAIRSDWHSPMDHGQWALVPDHKTITQIRKWVDSKTPRESKGPITSLWAPPLSATSRSGAGPLPQIKKHKYYMLPLDDVLKEVPLHRRRDIKAKFDPNVPETRHVFPFKDVGPLYSHIQPHFAIYAVGLKLAAIERTMDHEDFTDWLETLSLNASFGHRSFRFEQEKPGEEKKSDAQNLETLTDIQHIYRIWARHTDVPSEGHPWHVRADADN